MQIPKYAFLDLDNTLYSYDCAHKPAQNALNSFLAKQMRLKSADIEVDFESAKALVKKRLGNVASGHSRLLYIAEFMNQHGIISRPSFVLSAEQVYWSTFLANMRLFEGVKDFLTQLRIRSCKTILVTDLTSAIQYRKIGWLGLDNYFDLVITSEDAGGDKLSGLPEQLLVQLLNEPNPSGWSIGDEEWDHLFAKSTVFFHRNIIGAPRSTLREGNSFNTFSELLDKLQTSVSE
jgi:FMN phosphatase YigB (HAD superfamily)